MRYLIYETEQREIKVAQISYLVLDETNLYPRNYADYFQVEFYDKDDVDNLMRFFEISDKKYIKQDLSIYDCLTKVTHKLYGCFPASVDYPIDFTINDGKPLFTCNFDYKESHLNSPSNDLDEAYIKIYNRNKKLESIGI